MVLPNSDEFRQADLGMKTRRSGRMVGVSPHTREVWKLIGFSDENLT